ncbi:MAG: VOC family protein [Hyphomicrobiaceae bacterium]
MGCREAWDLQIGNMGKMAVLRVIGFSVTVADLSRTAAFYRDILELETAPERVFSDPAWNSLLGLASETTTRAVDVLVGRQTVELISFEPPGQLYPAIRASNDQWFQHLALVTKDIENTWERLRNRGFKDEITKGRPVRLPPNTGRVTAFKFRDPEGHPLELISFPPGVGSDIWRDGRGEGILGCDHTAISVMDLDRSLHFYIALLGFRITDRSLNHGPEQDRLDDLTACEVDVVALEPATASTPHVELLHYRKPRGQTLQSGIQANDVASVRQYYEVDDLGALVERLTSRHEIFVSPGIVKLKDGRAASAVRDPDGHMILLVE